MRKMKFWHAVKYWLGVFGLWLWVRSGFYYAYSRMVRWINQHKHRNGVPALREYSDIVAMQSLARYWTWMKDDWHVGWDSFMYPSAVQHKINSCGKRKCPIGDCDDWSIYIANLLGGIDKRSPIYGPNYTIDDINVLTICYIKKKDWSYGGHNVCFFRKTHASGTVQYIHVSNWGKAQLYTAGETFEDVIKHVCKNMNAVNLGYAVATLRVKREGRSGRIDRKEFMR